MTAAAAQAETLQSRDIRQPVAAMSDTHPIVLGTLGKLHAHGHGLFGYCRTCARLPRGRPRCGVHEIEANSTESILNALVPAPGGLSEW